MDGNCYDVDTMNDNSWDADDMSGSSYNVETNHNNGSCNVDDTDDITCTVNDNHDNSYNVDNMDHESSSVVDMESSYNVINMDNCCNAINMEDSSCTIVNMEGNSCDMANAENNSSSPIALDNSSWNLIHMSNNPLNAIGMNDNSCNIVNAGENSWNNANIDPEFLKLFALDQYDPSIHQPAHLDRCYNGQSVQPGAQPLSRYNSSEGSSYASSSSPTSPDMYYYELSNSPLESPVFNHNYDMMANTRNFATAPTYLGTPPAPNSGRDARETRSPLRTSHREYKHSFRQEPGLTSYEQAVAKYASSSSLILSNVHRLHNYTLGFQHMCHHKASLAPTAPPSRSSAEPTSIDTFSTNTHTVLPSLPTHATTPAARAA